jgi:para-nitrobenzyl esterase
MMSLFQAFRTYVGPKIDGQVIVETAATAFQAGHQMKIPVIAGATNRDMGITLAQTMPQVMAPFDFNQLRAYAAYDPNHTNDAKTVGMAVASDRLLVEPSRCRPRSVEDTPRPDGKSGRRPSIILALAERSGWVPNQIAT